MKKKLAVLLSLAAMFSVTGCQNENEMGSTAGDDNNIINEETTEPEQEVFDEAALFMEETGIDVSSVDFTKDASYPQLEQPKEGDPIVIITTNMGTIKAKLFPEYAPKAVENFTTHADNKYYDGTIFHRVVNEFMIQGGDPEGTGFGGESIWGDGFEYEVTPNLRSFRGALCMAHSQLPASNGSQFYIVQRHEAARIEDYQYYADNADKNIGVDANGNPVTNGDFFSQELIDKYKEVGGTPFLDFGYTVFGQVYEGMDVVDKIAVVETDESEDGGGRPITDVVIESITSGVY